jgi:hypothetical protein
MKVYNIELWTLYKQREYQEEAWIIRSIVQITKYLKQTPHYFQIPYFPLFLFDFKKIKDILIEALQKPFEFQKK